MIEVCGGVERPPQELDRKYELFESIGIMSSGALQNSEPDSHDPPRIFFTAPRIQANESIRDVAGEDR